MYCERKALKVSMLNHNTMDYLPIACLLISLICLFLTVFLSKQVKDNTLSKLNILGSELEEGMKSLTTQLDPIIATNSRAMGAVSSLSDDVKMDKALNRRIGLDLLDQNEDIVEVLKMAFPRVEEYVSEHPEAVTKLMPRLNKLLSDPEARERLNLGNFSKSDISRIWSDT